MGNATLFLLIALGGQRVSTAEAVSLRIDSQKAIAIVRKTLADLGAKPKISINEIYLMRHYTNAERPFWAVGAVDGLGRKCTMNLDASDGRLITLGMQGQDAKLASATNLTQAQIRSMAASFLKKVSGNRPFRLESCQVVGKNQQVFATFDALIDGKRFFNVNPAFQYNLFFFPSERRVSNLNAYDRLPPPPAIRPSLSKARALGAFETDLLASREWKEAKGNPSWGPVKRRMEAELGLYKWPRETRARFVWRVTGTIYQNGGGIDFPFLTYTRVVDAVTGKVYPILDKDGGL